jgi:hypothetical protein
MAQKVADLYLAEHFPDASVVEEAAMAPERTAAEVDPAIFDRYVGIYELRENLAVAITVEDGQLMGRPTGQSQVRLYPESETEYFLTVDDVQLTFSQSDTENEDSVYDRLTLQEDGRSTVAFRVGTSEPGSLSDFAGSYSSEELGVTYEIAVDNRWLSVRLGYGLSYSLASFGPDSFVSGLRIFSFQRDESGTVTGFEIDAGRVLNLKFRRN